MPLKPEPPELMERDGAPHDGTGNAADRPKAPELHNGDRTETRRNEPAQGTDQLNERMGSPHPRDALDLPDANEQGYRQEHRDERQAGHDTEKYAHECSPGPPDGRAQRPGTPCWHSQESQPPRRARSARARGQTSRRRVDIYHIGTSTNA